MSIRFCAALAFFVWGSVFTLREAAASVSAVNRPDKEVTSLLEVTPDILEYSLTTVKPILDASAARDKVSLLIKVTEILRDPETGIQYNQIAPKDYFIYNILQKIRLGFFLTWKFSNDQKQMLQRWHKKYMQKDPADVFFAPSADEIVRSKAAFGCTHYARAFIAVVKALGLIEKPEDLRYVISSKADDYNRALEKADRKRTMNGHQFVMVLVDSKWLAINTSKSEVVTMPEWFSPDSVLTHNIPIKFRSYPDIVFLLRKIGKDYNDDCGDDSLNHLMNIYRSGDPLHPDFKWAKL